MDARWYVVHIKPRKEDVVSTLLGRIGIETFYPKIVVKRKGIEKEEPMFPHYMFAKFKVPDDYLNVKFCRGVRRIVQFGEEIPYLSDSFIEELKKLNGSTIDFDRKELFRPGELVKITDGPFRGLIGEVIKTDDKNRRVMLLLKAASSSPKVLVPKEYLSKVG